MTKPTRRRNKETEAAEEKKIAKNALRRSWQLHANKIRHPTIIQKPPPGRRFHYKTDASKFCRSLKPWATVLEKKEGESATLVSERYVAYDDDENVLLAYYPKYLSEFIVSDVLITIYDLIREYPPPTPTDPRHTDWKSFCDMCGGQEFVGLYHFCTWFAQGQETKPPCLSSDAGSTRTRRLSTVAKFIRSLAILTFTLTLLYRSLNYESWTTAMQVVSEVCARHGPSKTVRSGKWDAWTGRAVLANLPTHAHRDRGDWLHGLAAIACFGSFTGGEFVVFSLKVKFPFQPGDVVFINSSLFVHFVTDWKPADFPDGKTGGRFSIVHFNHENIVKWAMSDDQSQSSGGGRVTAS